MAVQRSLKEILKTHTKEGEIYERLENDRLQCFACGHRCVILPGLDGICRVRYNEGGRLMVPTGYVAAIQCDPTEKKPFFHAHPGSLALTFGMLGCDYHCSYCFTGDTVVITDRGPVSFAGLFGSAERVEAVDKAEIAYPDDLNAVAASGRFRKVRAIFKHRYEGRLAVVQPYYLPALKCTPDHRVYATTDSAKPPEPVEARDLTGSHYLAIPRRFESSSLKEVSAIDQLSDYEITYKTPYSISAEDREAIIRRTALGETSRQIGVSLGKDPSYIRHIRSKGDGHRYANGKIGVTTVSRRLAYGIAWLALKLGYMPSIYEAPMSEIGFVQGRQVKRAPSQFTVAWYEDADITRKLVETEDYYLVPLRSVTFSDYEGDVYNMEVEEEHNYLAGFFAVSNCQNWVTSQALRDPKAIAPPRSVTPDQLVELARSYGARHVVSSYNEPLITSEWAVDVFKRAKPEGFVCGYVSNGNATPEVLDYIRPWTDLYKIDLKGFDDRNYRKLGGVLQNVLDTIKMVHERGFWTEIVTLIIPGFNDSEDELKAAADFLAGISPDIPWHVTAFHQDYKMTGPDNTSVETLVRAAETGYAAGLNYVYAGNLPGRVGRYENTFCPNCKATLIERFGFRILKNRITGGSCPDCKTAIPGVWG